MKLNLFALFALFVLFYSCEKEESSYTEVSGVVYTKGTSDPIANALVSLEWWDPAVFGETRYYVDSTRTNSAGEFKVAGDLPQYQEYYVIAHADKHFETEFSQGLKPNISRGKKQNLSLSLIPYGWVKMNIRKTIGNDYLRINRIPGGSINSFFTSSDDTIYSRILGNQQVKIDCFRYKNTNHREHLEYFINTLAMDTVEITIEF